jgi:acetyltransferase (GNAT) family protein
MTTNFVDPRPVIRPALPLDREAVLEFCKFIWDGHDYIPDVWDDWMADPSGQMFVAEYAGKAVGLGRLTLLAPGQWWLEGLRVDPAHQDRKIGTLMNDYLNALWLERGEGYLRLMTSAKRVKVHHMAEQHGMARIAERSFFIAEPRDSAGESAFIPLGDGEIAEAAQFAVAAESTALTGPMADVGWRFATPTDTLFRNFLRRGDASAYWWRDRKGLLLAWEDEWDEGRFLLVSLAACPIGDLTALLLDLRGLAAGRRLQFVGWNATLQPQMEGVLAEAGFRREDDGSGYIFEKRHPGARHAGGRAEGPLAAKPAAQRP